MYNYRKDFQHILNYTNTYACTCCILYQFIPILNYLTLNTIIYFLLIYSSNNDLAYA